MSQNDSPSQGEQQLPLSNSQEKRSSGLTLIFILISISVLTPIITIVVNKYYKPEFDSVQPVVADGTLGNQLDEGPTRKFSPARHHLSGTPARG